MEEEKETAWYSYLVVWEGAYCTFNERGSVKASSPEEAKKDVESIFSTSKIVSIWVSSFGTVFQE